MPGPSTPEGEPSWTLYDPARHRFIRIGWLEFEILNRWPLGRCDAIAKAIRAETTLAAQPEDVLEFLHFASTSSLLVRLGQQATERITAEQAASQSTPGQWLLKNYIFFRIRLFNPDALLGALHARLAWVFTRGFAITIALLALLGATMIARQWQHYIHSFLYLFSLEGAFEVAIALSFAKIVHELGHGLAAKHYGCRVPSMGAAFIVLWPVLWTDTTDAWRLNERNKRIVIDAAGMAAEIILAVIASLAWNVLPDGPERTGAFLLSSSTWLLTVAVNVNPLMRFDGYYLLSDLLDLPNLQDRAFALCRWRMRGALFGTEEPPPEKFTRERSIILLVYGFGCWVYRFLLFMGIAFLVYHLAFKALGIILMIVEIWWFIAKPILRELSAWRRHVQGARWNRHTWRTSLFIACVVVIFVLPFHSHVSAPALLRAERQATLYSAEPGQLTKLAANGQMIAKGDEVATLTSPDIEYRLKRSLYEASAFKAQLAGQAFDPEGKSVIQASWSEFDEAQARQRSMEAEATKLHVRAPFAGIVTDVPSDLKPGIWLPRKERLGVVIDPSSQIAEAFVGEADLERVHVGDKAIFLPENGEASVALHVSAITTVALSDLQVADLASTNGGGIAVRKEQNGALIPESAVYHILLVPDPASSTLLRKQRGTVEIAGTRISWAKRLYQYTAGLLIRETGL